ncbi:hypothetical protein STEG23_003967 [Scotinomys teguina]
MEEDILALMEALTTQASDTDPDPVDAASAGVAPPVQTLPLEDALSSACHGVNLEQKIAHQKETEETREIFSFSPCLSASSDPDICTDVALEVSPDTNAGGNRGKKSSRKRRNKMKRKVYHPWPMTLETRESSASQASVIEALSSKEQRRRKGEKEKPVALTQLWQKPASTLLPEASPVQPSLEGFSAAARKKGKAQNGQHCRKTAKNQKAESSPWPLTVQAWASFANPELVQTSFTEFLPVANYGIEDEVSFFNFSNGTQTDTLGSPAPLLQAFWEEVATDMNTKRKIKEEKHKGWQGTTDNALDHTWSPEIQAWVPLQAAAAAPVQAVYEDMSLQWECWPPLESEKERKGTEEGSFSAISPLQISLKEVPVMKFGQSETDEARRSPHTGEEQLQGSEMLALESYQCWGNVEQYQGDQNEDDWDYSILDLLTQAECYCGDHFSEEGKAPPVTGSDAYTSISEAVTGRQEAEENKATFQTLWMGKWGGF